MSETFKAIVINQTEKENGKIKDEGLIDIRSPIDFFNS